MPKPVLLEPTPTDTPLTFATFRQANRTRVPLFLSVHGEPAHQRPDGSDWSPARWFSALIGEAGEFARLRLQYDAGKVDAETYRVEAAKELADIQAYLDLLAMRALDETEPEGLEDDPDQALLAVIAALGEYANWRKKLQRGDITAEQFAERAGQNLAQAYAAMGRLTLAPAQNRMARVTHPTGVDLGAATQAKFNEVSDRVGAPVKIVDNAVVAPGTARR